MIPALSHHKKALPYLSRLLPAKKCTGLGKHGGAVEPEIGKNHPSRPTHEDETIDGEKKTAATPAQDWGPAAATVYVHRRSATEFSCGMDDRRALLVEESLDERERRG